MSSLILEDELHATLASPEAPLNAIAAALIAPSNSSRCCRSQLPLQPQAADVAPPASSSGNSNSDGGFVPRFLDVPPLAARPGTLSQNAGKHLALQSSWIQRLRGAVPQPAMAVRKPQCDFSKPWKHPTLPQLQQQQFLWESNPKLLKNTDESVDCCVSEHSNLISCVPDTATATVDIVSSSWQDDTFLPLSEERIDESALAPTSRRGKLESDQRRRRIASRNHTVVRDFSQAIITKNRKRRRVSSSDAKPHASVAENQARQEEASITGGAIPALDEPQEFYTFPEDLSKKKVIKDPDKLRSTQYWDRTKQPADAHKLQKDAKSIDQTPNLTPLFTPLESIFRMKSQIFTSMLEMQNQGTLEGAPMADQAPKQAIPIFKPFNSPKDSIAPDPTALYENSFVCIKQQ